MNLLARIRYVQCCPFKNSLQTCEERDFNASMPSRFHLICSQVKNRKKIHSRFSSNVCYRTVRIPVSLVPMKYLTNIDIWSRYPSQGTRMPKGSSRQEVVVRRAYLTRLRGASLFYFTLSTSRFCMPLYTHVQFGQCKTSSCLWYCRDMHNSNMYACIFPGRHAKVDRLRMTAWWTTNKHTSHLISISPID